MLLCTVKLPVSCSIKPSLTLVFLLSRLSVHKTEILVIILSNVGEKNTYSNFLNHTDSSLNPNFEKKNPSLKGYSSYFTDHIQCICHWWYYSLCENSCILSFLALQGAIKNKNKNPWWCHLGYFGSGLDITDLNRKLASYTGMDGKTFRHWGTNKTSGVSGVFVAWLIMCTTEAQYNCHPDWSMKVCDIATDKNTKMWNSSCHSVPCKKYVTHYSTKSHPTNYFTESDKQKQILIL